MLFWCVHIPWTSSNRWDTKPVVQLSTDPFECISW
jgi:hypothetical protein